MAGTAGSPFLRYQPDVVARSFEVTGEGGMAGLSYLVTVTGGVASVHPDMRGIVPNFFIQSYHRNFALSSFPQGGLVEGDDSVFLSAR